MIKIDEIISVLKKNRIDFISGVPDSLFKDLCFKFENIYKVSKQINQKLIKEITLFDVYEGKNLPKNKKSYGISFKMQDNEKTLSEAEIESVMSNITSKLKKEFNAELR